MVDDITGFGKRLSKRMMEMKLSQADVCRLTGLSSSMLSGYCTGQRTPSVHVAAILAKAINTTIDFLVTGNPEKATLSPDDILLIDDGSSPYTYKPKPTAQEKRQKEQAMLDLFRKLNSIGQAKALLYVSDLHSIAKYVGDR